MKYIFILGRNIELSVAEIKSYLQRESYKILNESSRENALFLELDGELPNNVVNSFGGVISIGKVLSQAIEKELDKIEIYMGKENKLNYVLWNYSEIGNEIKEYLKQKFKQEKLKATLKPMNQNLETQEGKKFKIPSSKRINEEYFVFSFEKENYFGKMIQKCNYKEIEKRDMEKPIRRSSLAISPRLAKIMINLSGVKKGEILIDPFCGIGAILQEALIQKIKVIGIDKDKSAISGAKQNLKWFGFSQENHNLMCLDSKKANIPNANVIVTEPDLGEVLKNEISLSKAKKTLNNFENLIIDVLNNLKSKVSGNVVFTSPLIKVGKKRISCDIEEITKNTGMRLFESFEDYRENQIVGRKIFVLK